MHYNNKHKQLAQAGLGSFQPFLQSAQSQAALASGLGTAALGIGTAQAQLGGIPTGAQAFQQGVQQFMSPYQSQVIDATLAEFDRNKANTRTTDQRSTNSFGCARQWSSGSATRRVWHRGCERTSVITSRSLATRFWSSTSKLDNKTLQTDLV